jgi:isopentenyl phosphate kinase
MVSLLKLGGSIVTFKDKPLAFNSIAVDNISKALSKFIEDEHEHLIIVHGGGSFGHYYSVKYDIHSRVDRYSLEGISYVRCSMVELNHLIVSIMLKNGLKPFTVHPSSLFIKGKDINLDAMNRLKDMAEHGLVPVVHGDIMHYDKDLYYILSGDELMSIIARYVNPKVAVFALSVDGVYKDIKSKELVKELKYASDAFISEVSIDVTGGMKRKIREAFNIASMGIDVWFVNGLYTDRVVDALKGYETVGTIVRGRV